MKQSFKEFFSFTKAERRGIFVLLLLISILLIYDFLSPFDNPFLSENEIFKQEVDAFLASKEESKEKPKQKVAKKKKNQKKVSEKHEIKPHPFDPNLMTHNQWVAMGLSERQARTIEKYKSKGGYFRKPEDFKKIYCISSEEYEIMLPYIVINTMEEDFIDDEKKLIQLDLNTVNMVEIQCVNGIGPSYAKRITKYRKMLGGYVDISQLMEVYGMDAERYQQISPYFTLSLDSIHKLSLNNASFSQLKYHPYISKDLAYEITDYRKIHGKFKSVEDLKKISLVNDSLYQKIYLYFAAD